MVLQFKPSGSGDENGLGSKPYPSNILGMRSKGITGFMQSLSRVRQNRTSEKKRSAASVDEYILCTNPFLVSRSQGSTGGLNQTYPLKKIIKILLAVLKAFL